MRIALSLLFVFGLAGCSGYFSNPGAIPTGYKYHGTTYNARPGPEVPLSKKESCKEKCASGTCSKKIESESSDVPLVNEE